MRARLRQQLLDRLLAPPFGARHVEHSLLASLDDEPAAPSGRLLDLALAAASAARDRDLASVAERIEMGPRYPAIWPGEHYRLLAGLVAVLRPALVVEIGTFTGASALALAAELPPGGRVVTFDVVPWNDVPETILRTDDFATGLLEQIVDDVTRPEGANRHRDLLTAAEVFFVDAAKDGEMEARLVRIFDSLAFSGAPIVVFDDIRLWNMLAVWRSIAHPKLDLTSFGHWTGTGLVEWGGAR